MSGPQTIHNLQQTASRCREEIIKMISAAGCGHPGSSLSSIDILVALFLEEMQIDKTNLLADDRDRFVLSKGHAAPALYSVFAEIGYLERSEFETFRQVNSRLQGHPDVVKLPLVEASTGSLGQGLSIAQGLALGMKQRKLDRHVFSLVGDGEIQEGQIWETAMSAPKFGLNNLTVFLDNNNGQIDGHVDEVMNIGPMADKWRAFNWNVVEIDGHNFAEILEACAQSRAQTDKPTLVWAHTVKGKGVSFMENQIKWHGIAPNAEETEQALNEIRSARQS